MGNVSLRSCSRKTAGAFATRSKMAASCLTFSDMWILLQDAFSLLAYSDPWTSPVGYQLDAVQREPVCSTLNSAILGIAGMFITFEMWSSWHGQAVLMRKSRGQNAGAEFYRMLWHRRPLFFSSPETHNLPKQPPLAQAVGQAAQCLAIMARTGIGSCAFASVDDYLH